MDNKIYMLTCEDYRNRAWGMATPVFSKIFSSVEKAKEYAETFYWRGDLRWIKDKNKWVVDACAFGYEIEEVEIDSKPLKYKRS